MRVLIHVRGEVDEVDLWPYVMRAEPATDGSLLTVEVDDGRDLVGVLVALTDRGFEPVTVHPIDRTEASEGGHDPDDDPAAAR